MGTPFTHAEAVSFLWCLRDCGFAVGARDGQLVVSPASRLVAADVDLIKLAKPELLKLLAAERELSGA